MNESTHRLDVFNHVFKTYFVCAYLSLRFVLDNNHDVHWVSTYYTFVSGTDTRGNVSDVQLTRMKKSPYAYWMQREHYLRNGLFL